ncbi:hypothetical protein Tco_0991476 [Tanacetum coccineum]|uniref:Uncharacterized protein n=1 Tax=Tanacetum coccineum TaxID=301880 RepID=A0ABQ5F0U9_9ASTR
MPQLMQNLEDSSDPTSAMNEALSLMAKAFKLNTIPTNNNQRKIANQYGNGNVVTAPLAYLQQQLQIAQEEESEIQKALRGSKFMATDAIEETERVKKLNKLEDENVPLELQVHSYAKENEHLKTTYKNLFDSIKVTQAQTKSIIDSLQKQLYDTIYENAKLRAQLFDKVSKPKGTTKGSLASSRPSKPRTCLRWIPTGRIFAMCGKLTASSNTENKSEKSMYDNASTSNPSKPSSKGFPISTSLLGSYQD